MTTIETMYAPQVNSPATTLSANISSSATSISVLSGATLPAAPNLLVIGGDTENAETVRMTAKSGNTITVVRGVQGTARAWNSGATIARLFTAKDLADVQANIIALYSGKAEASDLAAAEQRIDDVYASTASGPVATFERITGGMPVNSLEVAITPKQAGTGDPSPTNVRAISGWTGATIYQSGADTSDPSTTSISWNTEAGTVYGGTLDVTTGLLTVTKRIIDLTSTTGSNWLKSTNYPGGFYLDIRGMGEGIKQQTPFLCSHAKTVTRVQDYVNGTCYCDGSINIRIMDASTTKEQWKQYLADQSTAGTPVMVCAELVDEVTYQLTPTEVSTLQGTNNIWADTGDVIEVTFGEDIKQYIDETVAGFQDEITASGILKGDGAGGVSAAVAGTDYQAPLTAGTDYQTPLAENALQYYGVCSTSASTQAKTVSITGITALTEGLEIRVKMTNAQTYNGTPTLNVNSLGAKTIKQHGSTDAVRYQWQAGEVISFTYDGTYWVIENNSLATTTYFGLTRLNSATNSTAEDCAATPKAVKTAYDLADAAIPATEKGTDVATLATVADSTTPSVPRITPAQSFAPIFDITADTTLAAKHAGGILKCTNSPTITIPSNVFAEATQIEILNYGTGVVTIAGASGCSVNGTSAGSVTLADQYKSAVLLAISASQWVIQGAIE